MLGGPGGLGICLPSECLCLEQSPGFSSWFLTLAVQKIRAEISWEGEECLLN